MNESLQEKAERLEKELSEIKEAIKNQNTLEIGKWYKDQLGGFWYYEGKSESKLNPDKAYGIAYDGDWMDSDERNFREGKSLTPATDKEVEEALIKEAKKRGFKEGVKINNLHEAGYGNKIPLGGNLNFNPTTNSLRTDRCDGRTGILPLIFHKGKWAEIISKPEFKEGDIVVGWMNTSNKRSLHINPWKIGAIDNDGYIYPKCEPEWNTSKGNIRHATPEEIEQFNKRRELPEIEGYKGKDEGNYLKYGCAEIPKFWFVSPNCNREIASFKLTNGIKFTENHVSQIREYLNSK